MEKEKKLRGRAKRASYFVMTASGEYVYSGPVYAARNHGRLSPGRAQLCRWGMGLACLALAVADGCLTAPGMSGTFYVLLPYVAGLICAAMLVWAAYRMGRGDEPLREYIYESTAKALPARTVATAICAGLTLIGEAAFLIRNGRAGAGIGPTVFFVLSQIGILVMAMLWFCMERALIWEKQS